MIWLKMVKFKKRVLLALKERYELSLLYSNPSGTIYSGAALDLVLQNSRWGNLADKNGSVEICVGEIILVQ